MSANLQHRAESRKGFESKKKSGFIQKGRVKEKVTIIENAALQNESLSWQARGLLGYLLSLPPDWIIHKTSLHKKSKCNGRDATANAFNELIEAGYVHQQKIDGNLLAFNYHVYQNPDDGFSVTENPASDISGSENPCATKETPPKETETKETETNSACAEPWPSFDDFWIKYDKKIARPKCENLWKKINQGAREKIMSHLDAYTSATPEKKFRKNPETYLRNASWEDEVISPFKPQLTIEDILNGPSNRNTQHAANVAKAFADAYKSEKPANAKQQHTDSLIEGFARRHCNIRRADAVHTTPDSYGTFDDLKPSRRKVSGR